MKGGLDVNLSVRGVRRGIRVDGGEHEGACGFV